MTTVLETPHVIVGAAIAAKIPNPLISIPLAFASHFVLDMVPHWNPHINTELKNGGIKKGSKLIILSDVGISLLSGFAISGAVSSNITGVIIILTACFAAVLPDLIEAPYFFLGYRKKWMLSYLKSQKAIQADIGPYMGILTQVAVIVASVWWIFS